MSTARFIFTINTALDSAGESIAGAKLESFEAGTSTPLATYTDQALTIPHTNPIIADGSGRFPEIFLLGQDYKFILSDADDVVIWTIDDYSPNEVNGPEDFVAENYIKRNATNDGWDNLTPSAVFADIKEDATEDETGVTEIATQAEVNAGTDDFRYITPLKLKTALSSSTLSLAAMPRGYIDGFQTQSNSGNPTTDVDFGEGVARFEDETGAGAATSVLIKQANNDWAAGDNMGGMPARTTLSGTFTSVGTAVTGAGSDFANEFQAGDVLYSSSNGEFRCIDSIASPTSLTLESAFTVDVAVAEDVETNGLAPNCHYHMFALFDESDNTAFDFGFDTRVDASFLLADANVVSAEFDKYRRIGSIWTDGSALIRTFKQVGDEFWYDTKILDSTTINAVLTDVPLTVPRGVNSQAILDEQVRRTGSGGTLVFYKSNVAGDQIQTDWLAAGIGELDATFFKIIADTNGEIQNLYTSSAPQTYELRTLGWVDYRGKDK